MLSNSRYRSISIQLIIAFLLLNSPLTLLAQTQNQQQSQAQNQTGKSEQKPAQNPPGQTPDASQDPDNVVRITTQLVQIDAVVTDGKGKHVENLSEDDFELTVDGKKQTLTYFRSVKLAEPKPPESASAKDGVKPSKNAPPPPNMPTKQLAPEEVKRTIAFVVDDLGLSFESTYYAREAIKKFVREQMQEGDLVGIIRTGRGLGALQQFTSDKRILYTAIDKLTWNPYSRDMIPRFGVSDPNDQRSPEARAAENRAEDFRDTVFSVGTLGALNFVVRGLRELPGRKMAILLSDGFRLFGRERDNSHVVDNLRRLVDLANRSSVVVYSIDAKGLQTLMPDASTGGTPKPEDYSRVSQDNFDSQEGLTYIARETGGLAFLNSNDVNLGIRKAIEDGQSFYLLGFDPEDEKFDRRYHSIKLKLTRPGLKVRTRAGFIGVPDRERSRELLPVAGPEARSRQILSALYSPFGARDISLQMTSFFFNSPKNEPFVRSLLHIDPSKLSFKDDPQVPGRKTLQMEIVSFLFNEVGAVIDQHGNTFSLSFDETQYKVALIKGMSHTNDFNVKKPGAYQFRTVLRDPETGKLGSAGQFIQVPDLTKKRLTLSGMVITAPPEVIAKTLDETIKNPSAEQAEINPAPDSRRFPRGSAMDYGVVAYNAKLDQSTGKPQLHVQVEIFSNGKVIYQTPGRSAECEGKGEGCDIGGRFSLGGLQPGDYLLHLIVTDPLVKAKYGRTEQWMDFSVR